MLTRSVLARVDLNIAPEATANQQEQDETVVAIHTVSTCSWLPTSFSQYH